MGTLSRGDFRVSVQASVQPSKQHSHSNQAQHCVGSCGDMSQHRPGFQDGLRSPGTCHQDHYIMGTGNPDSGSQLGMVAGADRKQLCFYPCQPFNCDSRRNLRQAQDA